MVETIKENIMIKMEPSNIWKWVLSPKSKGHDSAGLAQRSKSSKSGNGCFLVHFLSYTDITMP